MLDLFCFCFFCFLTLSLCLCSCLFPPLSISFMFAHCPNSFVLSLVINQRHLFSFRSCRVISQASASTVTQLLFSCFLTFPLPLCPFNLFSHFPFFFFFLVFYSQVASSAVSFVGTWTDDAVWFASVSSTLLLLYYDDAFSVSTSTF